MHDTYSAVHIKRPSQAAIFREAYCSEPPSSSERQGIVVGSRVKRRQQSAYERLSVSLQRAPPGHLLVCSTAQMAFRII